jgi:hypothetical protein
MFLTTQTSWKYKGRCSGHGVLFGEDSSNYTKKNLQGDNQCWAILRTRDTSQLLTQIHVLIYMSILKMFEEPIFVNNHNFQNIWKNHKTSTVLKIDTQSMRK